MNKIAPKNKTFVERMFNDLDDIHKGSDEEAKQELIDMGIDIDKAQLAASRAISTEDEIALITITGGRLTHKQIRDLKDFIERCKRDSPGPHVIVLNSETASVQVTIIKRTTFEGDAGVKIIPATRDGK